MYDLMFVMEFTLMEVEIMVSCSILFSPATGFADIFCKLFHYAEHELLQNTLRQKKKRL